MSKSVCIITGIITAPAAYPSLYDLLSIFNSQGIKIDFFQSDVDLDFSFFENITIHRIPYNSPKIKIFRFFTFLFLQLRISIQLIVHRQCCKTVILIYGGEEFSIPILLLKILHKHVILFYVGSMPRILSVIDPKKSILYKYIQRVNSGMSDEIILYSPKLISEWDFGRSRDKIIIAHEYFLNDTFTITMPFSERPPLIGYIGRLSGEKGIQNFVQALRPILKNRKDLKVLIGGDGELMESIKTFLAAEKLTDRVNLPGWISHDDLPQYFNQLQLLVLPSYTEGLPNIMIEALSCGTPVLATPVGAIPDIIKEGETGFIMRDNSPECIAENVIRALSSPGLEMIAQNGKKLVEENFTFERTSETFRNVFDNL